MPRKKTTSSSMNKIEEKTEKCWLSFYIETKELNGSRSIRQGMAWVGYASRAFLHYFVTSRPVDGKRFDPGLSTLTFSFDKSFLLELADGIDRAIEDESYLDHVTNGKAALAELQSLADRCRYFASLRGYKQFTFYENYESTGKRSSPLGTTTRTFLDQHGEMQVQRGSSSYDTNSGHYTEDENGDEYNNCGPAADISGMRIY